MKSLGSPLLFTVLIYVFFKYQYTLVKRLGLSEVFFVAMEGS